MIIDNIFYNLTYFSPLFAYFAAGGCKFLINCFYFKKFDLSNNGLGGFPSTHNSICSAMLFSTWFNDGIGILFTVSLSVAIIVMIDSLDLRKKIQYLTITVNLISNANLSQRVAHNVIDVVGAYFLGFFISYFLFFLKNI